MPEAGTEPYGNLVVVDPHEFSIGSAARTLGVAAAALGRFDDADRLFQNALVMNGQIEARPWLARTKHDYARMLFARDKPGERGRAQKLCAAALAMYRELGMKRYATSVEELALSRG